MAKKTQRDPLISNNRKAYHDYIILDKYEAGIVLVGTEVKSCRAAAVNMQDSFIRIEKGEAWMQNVHIAPYEFGNRFNRESRRPRKLLLNKREILKLAQQTKERPLTIIPLKMYLKNGLVKVEIGLCQGKTHADKRESMRKQQDLMETRRALRENR